MCACQKKTCTPENPNSLMHRLSSSIAKLGLFIGRVPKPWSIKYNREKDKEFGGGGITMYRNASFYINVYYLYGCCFRERERTNERTRERKKKRAGNPISELLSHLQIALDWLLLFVQCHHSTFYRVLKCLRVEPNS